ncbi:MAG TPA: hypothetical protein VGN15_14735, partial [Ktedonobacteraceae bacterium]|nr:hypothetical protein [Ktedonobacteraceae bacterium]
RGAASEIIVHRKTGFLVRDVDEMVRFIPRVDEIDRNATREYIERNFSSRAMAEKYVKIYKLVIANAKGTTKRPFPELAQQKSLLTTDPAPAILRKALPAQLPQVPSVQRVTMEVESRH